MLDLSYVKEKYYIMNLIEEIKITQLLYKHITTKLNDILVAMSQNFISYNYMPS